MLAQIADAGLQLPGQAMTQHAVKERFSQRRSQFGAGLTVTTLAAIERDGDSSGASGCHVAIHQDGEFVVGHPNLWHLSLRGFASSCDSTG
jgi:hypothetical protein